MLVAFACLLLCASCLLLNVILLVPKVAAVLIVAKAINCLFLVLSN